MTTEKQAHAFARRYPEATHVGWLLACCSPVNNTKGQRWLDELGMEDSERAITYRNYCLALYAAHEAGDSLP